MDGNAKAEDMWAQLMHKVEVLEKNSQEAYAMAEKLSSKLLGPTPKNIKEEVTTKEPEAFGVVAQIERTVDAATRNVSYTVAELSNLHP